MQVPVTPNAHSALLATQTAIFMKKLAYTAVHVNSILPVTYAQIVLAYQSVKSTPLFSEWWEGSLWCASSSFTLVPNVTNPELSISR